MVLAAIASARSAAAFASLAACCTRAAAACEEAAACCAVWLAACAREAAWSARLAALTARCSGVGSFDEQPTTNERANTTAPANPTSLQDFVINPSIFVLLRNFPADPDAQLRPGFDMSFVTNPWLPCKPTQPKRLLQRERGSAARLRFMRLELLNNQEEIGEKKGAAPMEVHRRRPSFQEYCELRLCTLALV
jgi:hypothetical protein